jgi:hypothetical protein
MYIFYYANLRVLALFCHKMVVTSISMDGWFRIYRLVIYDLFITYFYVVILSYILLSRREYYKLYLCL